MHRWHTPLVKSDGTQMMRYSNTTGEKTLLAGAPFVHRKTSPVAVWWALREPLNYSTNRAHWPFLCLYFWEKSPKVTEVFSMPLVVISWFIWIWARSRRIMFSTDLSYKCSEKQNAPNFICANRPREPFELNLVCDPSCDHSSTPKLKPSYKSTMPVFGHPVLRR